MDWVVSLVGGTYTDSTYISGAEPAGTCTPGAWSVVGTCKFAPGACPAGTCMAAPGAWPVGTCMFALETWSVGTFLPSAWSASTGKRGASAYASCARQVGTCLNAPEALGLTGPSTHGVEHKGHGSR